MYLHFYVYAYLRKDGTPYYIGKGHGNRAWHKNHRVGLPKDKSRIVILEKNLTTIGALAIERRLIKWWGRKDLGTGILRNMSDGGEGAYGAVGRKLSQESKNKISNSKKGTIPWNKGISYRKGISKSSKMREKLSASKIGNKSKSSYWLITYNNGSTEKIYNLKQICQDRDWKYNTINVAVKKKDGVVPSLSATFCKL